MPPPPKPRFPLAPILGAIDELVEAENANRPRQGLRYHTVGWGGRRHILAGLGDVTIRQAARWLAEGALFGDRNADLIATRLGTHPACLWPVEWWAGTEAQEVA